MENREGAGAILLKLRDQEERREEAVRLKPDARLFRSSITQVTPISKAIPPEMAANRAAKRPSTSSRLISFVAVGGS